MHRDFVGFSPSLHYANSTTSTRTGSITASFSPSLHYANSSGRNDIRSAKVALSGKNLAFYAQTQGRLSPASPGDWMMLYIDAGQNPRTGWLGYDFRITSARGVIERNVGGAYQWGSPQKITGKRSECALELLVPLKYLGLAPGARGVDFKWADNCFDKGDWSDFTLNGDAAPNDRFSYRARW